MPRNASGVMSLPVGNPVIPGTLIDSSWANPTMTDLANELTQSLPRSGVAGMTGPLMLARDGILPKEAITVDQLTAAVTGTNSYLPAGAIQYFAMNSVPAGWREANGSAVSRTTYASLFGTIGTTYGAGNGTTTFNLPDLRGTFIRGFDNGRSLDPGRAFGSSQEPSNAPHNHNLTDPGHTHGASQAAHAHGVNDPGHAHSQSPHAHGVNDPGHAHSLSPNLNTGVGTDGNPNVVSGGGPAGGIGISASGTGISIQAAQPGISASGTGISLAASQPGVSVGASNTGITSSSNGLEARPVNVALIACIKAFGGLQTDGLGSMAFQNKEAVQIIGGTGVFSSLQSAKAPTEPNDVARLSDIGGVLAAIYSSDPQIILVDNTTPSAPVLRVRSNVPNGMVKLNEGGLVPPELINLSGLNYQGPWDASGGNTPSAAFPLVTWNDGDFFEISVAGVLVLFSSSGVASSVMVNKGDSIVWMDGSPAYITPGWYYQPFPVVSSLSASAVSFVPGGTVASTDVQAAILEVSSEAASNLAAAVAAVDAGFVSKTSDTGAAHMPVGTTAQRPIAPDLKYGDERTNSDTNSKEWWNGTNWVPLGGGQMLGNALVKGISFNSNVIAEDILIPANTNAYAVGPIDLSNAVITFGDNSTWTIL